MKCQIERTVELENAQLRQKTSAIVLKMTHLLLEQMVRTGISSSCSSPLTMADNWFFVLLHPSILKRCRMTMNKRAKNKLVLSSSLCTLRYCFQTITFTSMAINNHCRYSTSRVSHRWFDLYCYWCCAHCHIRMSTNIFHFVILSFIRCVPSRY